VTGLRSVACIRRLADDHEVSVGAEEIVPLASVGKLLLLGEVARRISDGSLSPDERLPIRDADRALGGTGLLARLSPSSWSIQDLVTAVASVSDNAATNVLLRAVTLDAVQSLARDSGMRNTTVHDHIRAHRGPGTPPQFATGTVRELAALLADVALERFVSPGTSGLLRSWLQLNVDRSLVADGIAEDGEWPEVANKTGTDRGVRADAGIARGNAVVVYAVVAVFPPGADGDAVRELRRWGTIVREIALEDPDVEGRPAAGHRRSVSRASSPAATRSSSMN
jgi:beta-lactamase class A